MSGIEKLGIELASIGLFGVGHFIDPALSEGLEKAVKNIPERSQNGFQEITPQAELKALENKGRGMQLIETSDEAPPLKPNEMTIDFNGDGHQVKLTYQEFIKDPRGKLGNFGSETDRRVIVKGMIEGKAPRHIVCGEGVASSTPDVQQDLSSQPRYPTRASEMPDDPHQKNVKYGTPPPIYLDEKGSQHELPRIGDTISDQNGEGVFTGKLRKSGKNVELEVQIVFSGGEYKPGKAVKRWMPYALN